jgi:hypothetical protein
LHVTNVIEQQRLGGHPESRSPPSPAYPISGIPDTSRRSVRSGGMFCSCCHAAESHHEDGCHALHRDRDGTLCRCTCRRSRERVNDGPDHLVDAIRLANAKARRRPT